MTSWLAATRSARRLASMADKFRSAPSVRCASRLTNRRIAVDAVRLGCVPENASAKADPTSC